MTSIRGLGSISECGTVQKLFRNEKDEEEKKESDENASKREKSKEEKKRSQSTQRSKGKRKKKGKTVSQQAQNSQQSKLRPVDECTELNDNQLINETVKKGKGWQWKVEKDSNVTIREFFEHLRAEEDVELEGTMKLKWDHAIPEEEKLNVQFELVFFINALALSIYLVLLFIFVDRIHSI